MLNRKMKVSLLSLALSLAITSLASGCGMLKKDTPETESETQSETETETETESETESELQTNVAFTSQDKSIRITLPDSTWKVTQDADEMRVFSSGSAAMINIVHAADAAAMKTISVAESEEALTESLSKQYSDTDSFEVVEFEKLSSNTLNTYEYVVKYNATSMWAYSITYGIIAENEAYVISGTVTDDNKVLLDAVQTAVESFTVLRNSAFTAMPGSAVNNQSESETKQSESTATDAASELNSLTEYGTSTTLYANDTVNIRLEPTTEGYDIIGSLAPGDQVTVIGETPQWFKVNVNGNIGYINKAYLESTVPSTETQQTDSTQNNTVSDSTKINAENNSYVDYGTSYTYYTTSDVNLRAQPGTDSSVLSSLGSGAAVDVIGETDNWFVVSVNGTKGYISKSYISSSDPGTGSTGGTTDPGGSTGNGSGSGGGTPSSGTGSISGTVTSASMNTITIAGDDGNTYTLDTTDAAITTTDGMYEGLYVSATVDYSNTTPAGQLYATSVTAQ